MWHVRTTRREKGQRWVRIIMSLPSFQYLYSISHLQMLARKASSPADMYSTSNDISIYLKMLWSLPWTVSCSNSLPISTEDHYDWQMYRENTSSKDHLQVCSAFWRTSYLPPAEQLLRRGFGYLCHYEGANSLYLKSGESSRAVRSRGGSATCQ